MTRPSLYAWAASWGIALPPYAMRALAAEQAAPALPRMPADLLRDVAAAAGIATCNPEPENDQ